MAKFRVHNEQAIAALLHGSDYLAKKFRQAEKELGKPIESISTELVDEQGRTWLLTFGPAQPTPAKPTE